MLERALRATLTAARFFAMVYLTYVCMHLAPTDRVRHWGAATWYLLFRLGPPWPAKVIGVHGMGWDGAGMGIEMRKEMTMLKKVLVDPLAETTMAGG